MKFTAAAFTILFLELFRNFIFPVCRSETIEAAVCGSFSPIENKVKQWIVVFSTFDKADVKALEKLLMQKKRSA